MNYQLKSFGLNTKVGFINLLREKGLPADFLAVMTYENGDPVYSARDGLIAFQAHDLPKLRILYSVAYETCFQVQITYSRKCSDLRGVLDRSVRALWIGAEVLHSRPNHKHRQKLVDTFNDLASSLKVLIMMVDVASQGLHLQQASYRVISMIPTK